MAVIRLCEPIGRKSLWIAALSELIGTALLVILGVGSVYLNFSHEKDNIMAHGSRLILTGVDFGLVVGGLVFIFGFGFPHGSAHFNPAFTLGCLVLDKVSVVRALIFAIAQFIGGLIGGGFLYAVFTGMRDSQFACTHLGSGATPLQGFGLEVAGTFTLVFCAFALIAACERHNYGPAAIATGICILILIIILVIGPYTGASINPARSLGPAVFFGGKCWTHHWIYWTGPLTGGLLGGGLVRILLYQEEQPAPTRHSHDEVHVEMLESHKFVTNG